MRFPTLATVACFALTLNAQWSLDPAAPMVVCDAANDQSPPQAMSDGAGGWYAFWMDKRTNTNEAELYGQHFNAAGMAQWATNGKQLLALPGRCITSHATVIMADGDVLMAVLSKYNGTNGSDTVRAYRFDSDGEPVWDAPALLSVSGPGIFGNCFGFSSAQGIASADGAYFCYRGDSQGSNGYYVMQRVRGDGSVAFPVPGIAVPGNAGFGPFQILPDGNAGMLVGWRCSNGAGTCHRAMRVDSLGAAVGQFPLDVSAGGGGLSYAFTMGADGTGSFISLWEENADIGMARYDTLGTMVWSPSPLYACTESHTQMTPALTVVNGELYVAWGDNRPPANNRDLYMQKIDLASGAPLWNADGVAVIQTNSYIPTARVVPSIDGAIGIMDFTGTSKYCAMRMNSDGTAAWSAPTSFATADTPNDDERVELPDGSGGVVSFWRTYNGDLFAARIYANGELGDHTGVGEVHQDGIMIRPNPASDRITVQWPAALERVAIRVIASDGRTIASWTPGPAHTETVDVSAWSLGCYVVRIEHAAGMISQRFIKH